MQNQNIKQIIAENIKFYREANNLQKKTVAEYLGVSAASVTHWEDGSNSIDINKLALLCKLFKCTISEMVTCRSEHLNYASLTHDENNLITGYRKLNETGKAKVTEYVEDLTCNEKYTCEEYSAKESHGA